MEDLQKKGTITAINTVETGKSKAGKEWKRQSFVIDTGDQYNPNICFSLFGEKKIGELNNYKVGDQVNVYFNLSSREFNDKWYHSIDAWKIASIGDAPAPQPAIDSLEEEDDDLPF